MGNIYIRWPFPVGYTAKNTTRMFHSCGIRGHFLRNKGIKSSSQVFSLLSRAQQQTSAVLQGSREVKKRAMTISAQPVNSARLKTSLNELIRWTWLHFLFSPYQMENTLIHVKNVEKTTFHE